MKNQKNYLFFALLTWILTYFIINQLVENKSHYYDFSTAFDNLIPLVPIFAIIYVSAYVLMFIYPLFFENTKAYFYSFFALVGITFFSFLVFPGYFPRPELGNDIFSRFLAWIYSVDKPYNLFPSSHVSLTVLNALIFKNVWVYIWAVLIILATLFTKQHYILDALSGALLGFICYKIYKINLVKA